MFAILKDCVCTALVLEIYDGHVDTMVEFTLMPAQRPWVLSFSNDAPDKQASTPWCTTAMSSMQHSKITVPLIAKC